MPSVSITGYSRLAEVFTTERKRLLQTVRRRLFDVSLTDAEDLVQDVFQNILRRGDMVEQIENLTAYVYQSLSNRILDRRRAPSREVSLDDEEGPGEGLLRRALEPVNDQLGPEEALLRKQLREDIRTALYALGERERAVWVATELERRSFKELADAWDEPIGTLLSRKSRAGKLLRARLQEIRREGHA